MNLRQKLGWWKYFAAALVALGISATGVILLMNMEIFGHRIPSPNVSIDYLKGLIWALLLLFLLQFFPIPSPHKKGLSTIWIIKIFVTLGAMLIYEERYILDAYSYYKQSVNESAQHSFAFFDGTLFIEWLGSTINRFLPYTNAYHALKVLWAFAGLMAIYSFFLAYTKISKVKGTQNLLILALFPSVLFWTSILGKDPLNFLGIGIFTLGIAYLDRKEGKRALIIIISSLLLVSLVRFWLAPLLLAGLCGYIIFTGERTRLQRTSLFLAFSTGLYLALRSMFRFLKIYDVNEFVARINFFSRSWSTHGGSGQAPPSFNSAQDLMMFIPKGAFTALFRPLPGEVNNLFGLLAGLENLLVLILAIYVVRYGKGITRAYPFLNFCIAFVVVWSIFYGFISYQNLGTAFRFRLQVLPLLLMIFVLTRERKNKLTQ